LLHEVQGTDIRLIIGGGFGIYLKTDHMRRTLFAGNELIKEGEYDIF